MVVVRFSIQMPPKSLGQGEAGRGSWNPHDAFVTDGPTPSCSISLPISAPALPLDRILAQVPPG